MSNFLDVAQRTTGGTVLDGGLDVEQALAQLPSLSVDDRRQLEALFARLQEDHAAQLHARDEQLRLVLGAAQMGIWEGDRRLGHQHWSPELERLLGIPQHGGPYSAEDFYRLVHPEDLAAIRASLAEAEAAGASSVDDLFRVVRPDGSVAWLASRTILHRDEQGRVVQLIGVNTDVTAHKQIEQALRQSNETMTALLTACPLAVMVLDADGLVHLWNPAAERLYGWTAEEVLGDFLPAIRESERAAFRARLQSIIQGQTVAGLEAVRRKKGGSFVAQIWTAPFTLADGTRQCISVVEDITERKRSEAALRESQHFLQQLTETVPSIIYVYDLAEDRNIYANRQLWDVLGYTPEEAQAMGSRFLATVLHPEDWAENPAYVARLLALPDGAVQEREYRIRHRDGSWRWFFGREMVFARDQAGRAIQILGSILDVTERKHVEEQLTTANHRFRLAEAAAGGFNYDWDLETGVVTRSESLSRVLGYCPDEIGASWAAWGALIHPDDRWLDSAEAAVAAVREHPDEILSNEYRVCHRDGHYVWVLERAITLRDEHGRVRRVIGQTVDITERKLFEAERERLYAQEQAARAQAEEASRLKDEFLATVSHELRTPLTAFLGYAHLLQSRQRDEAYVARTVDRMVQSAKAQAQLVEDLLDVSRIVSGKLRLEMQTLDLCAVVQAAIDTVRPMVEAKNLRLRVEMPETHAMVRGDAGRLQQVAWNLLTNAAKFTPPGGTIAVRLASDGQDALLSVTDTGQGISAAFLPYVFDQFRQADSTSQRAHGGLGLGLTIVRRLVELHGGAVGVASAGEGKGATFTVHLPPARSEHGALELLDEADVARVRATYPVGLSGLRVLVVDDQPDILELLYEIIAPGGAEVRLCSSAREAFELLRCWRPDALISDIAMPGEDGYWLIRQVRALAPEEGGAVPAVALTAYVRVEDRIRVLAEGFQLYVPKPIEPDELLDVLARLVQARALQ